MIAGKETRMHDWAEGDDLAALYVSRYGTTGLPYSVETIATDRGIQPGSFDMRVRNFKAIEGEGRLTNYAKQTESVYQRFRLKSMEELRRIAFPEL